MTITITLDDDVLAGLQSRAERQQRSVEELAVELLTAALDESELLTPQDVVERIQAMGPNLAQIRPATANLTDLLQSAPDDPDFDPDDWQRQWNAVAAGQAAITRANDIAEGRRSN